MTKKICDNCDNISNNFTQDKSLYLIFCPTQSMYLSHAETTVSTTMLINFDSIRQNCSCVLRIWALRMVGSGRTLNRAWTPQHRSGHSAKKACAFHWHNTCLVLSSVFRWYFELFSHCLGSSVIRVFTINRYTAGSSPRPCSIVACSLTIKVKVLCLILNWLFQNDEFKYLLCFSKPESDVFPFFWLTKSLRPPLVNQKLSKNRGNDDILVLLFNCGLRFWGRLRSGALHAGQNSLFEKDWHTPLFVARPTDKDPN